MLTLADGRTRLDISLTAPDGYYTGEGPLEVSLADLDLISSQGQINKPDCNLSAADSDTVPDQPLEAEGNATTFGASNYEGSLTVLRQKLPNGRPDEDKDTVFIAIGEKNALAFYFERIGPKATLPLAAGDEGWIYEARSDAPKSAPDQAGYIKNIIRLGVQSRRRFVITGSAPGGD